MAQSAERSRHACLKASFAQKLEAIPDRFAAWRHRDKLAQPLDIAGDDLAEVLQSACASCGHKDVLFIQHTAGFSGKLTLHCYVIRQGKPEWRRNPETSVPHQVRPLHPDLIFAMPLAAPFVPEEPWQWTPGCDVVGIDRTVVEQRA